ncbi:MAG: 4-alpha-glucanotransferase [Muribaculaceae bacterium]|nr:4-alpha-glucanotransferase [Muribaculaceae bacterium]
MKLTFEIDYATRWGESLLIIASITGIDGKPSLREVPMQCHGYSTWRAVAELPDKEYDIEYRYVLRREDGSERREWGSPRTLHTSKGLAEAYVYDAWQDIPEDSAMYSSAFTESIFRHDVNAVPQIGRDTLLITAEALEVLPTHTLALCGSCSAVGEWNPDKAADMEYIGHGRWCCALSRSGVPDYFEYKLLIKDRASSEVITWEDSANRSVYNLPAAPVALSGIRFRASSAPWRGAGVVLPVFSLRSEADFGVGDFYDLIPLIDWAALTGLKFIQVLPVNDTTMTGRWTDSYPYNANSTFALHPMYLRPQAMGALYNAEQLAQFEAQRLELNKLPAMDYERVNLVKNEYTAALFAEHGYMDMASDEYRSFLGSNEYWLLPYAAFCVLRDRFGTPDTSQWADYSTYDKPKIEQFIDDNRTAIDYVCYIQYHLDRQLRHVRDYANAKGVALKGDIPIGISRDSADAWISPELFNLDCSAGAPPDDFSVMGQNWGFPTYNWERMAQDGFAWWKARFRKMAEYFSAYRIDHILGFFRIWQIPLHAVHGLLGTFNPALPLTPDELKYEYDFHFDADRFTHPYITDDVLGRIDPELSETIRSVFLTAHYNGTYRLRPEFNTQRKVMDYFAATHRESPTDYALRTELLNLIDDVLFIEDPVKKGSYHPRIAASGTNIYRSLTAHEREMFDRIHEDFYYHRHNDFWRESALWKLPSLISATNMLVCGEDLGMIPACVPKVMDELRILSLEIQRMPKELYAEFADTSRYPYLSVCATSTHDMEGIREWWEADYDRSSRFYHTVLHGTGPAPHEATPDVCRAIVNMHMQSPSMLCILPWQDLMAMDGKLRYPDPLKERINIPSDPRHYWRYRMHLTIESLLRADEFNTLLSTLIEVSSR